MEVEIDDQLASTVDFDQVQPVIIEEDSERDSDGGAETQAEGVPDHPLREEGDSASHTRGVGLGPDPLAGSRPLLHVCPEVEGGGGRRRHRRGREGGEGTPGCPWVRRP